MARRHRDHMGRFVLGMKHYPEPDDDGDEQTQSKAVGHTTEPIHVIDENPMDHHPGLTPLEHKRIRRIAGGAPSKSKVKVKVEVEAGHGD